MEDNTASGICEEVPLVVIALTATVPFYEALLHLRASSKLIWKLQHWEWTWSLYKFPSLPFC